MTQVVERLHLARALAWVPITAMVFFLGWQTSVVVVVLYSGYANLAGDLGVWQGRRAERRSLENPPSDEATIGVVSPDWSHQERLERIERKIDLLLRAASITIHEQESTMSAVDDLTAQVDALEASQEAESQAIKDAATRVASSLTELQNEITSLQGETSPDLSGLTARVADAAAASSALTQAAATIDPSTPAPEPAPEPTPADSGAPAPDSAPAEAPPVEPTI